MHTTIQRSPPAIFAYTFMKTLFTSSATANHDGIDLYMIKCTRKSNGYFEYTTI